MLGRQAAIIDLVKSELYSPWKAHTNPITTQMDVAKYKLRLAL